MALASVSAAGGFAALNYVFRKGRETGFLRLWKRLRSKNACKTCALGMGGQRGGLINERGTFPEVCKKSIQAVSGDLQGAIPESFFQRTPIAQLGWMTPKQLEDLGRITFPLIAEPGDTHYRRITWEEALRRCAEAFKAAPPERTFIYSSGRASNEAAFLLQLVARAYGTPNLHNCSFYCHQSSGVALQQVYGSGTASLVLDDLAEADLALVVGANPASNHPRLITQLVEMRHRGGKVIVINPLKELGLVRFRIPSKMMSMLLGSTVNDLYLQPKIGGDIALLKGLLKGVLELKAEDGDYLRDYVTGWEAVRTDIEASDWKSLVQESGVPESQMREAAELLAKAKRGIALWAMGLTHHTWGVDNILALSNLTLSRGWLGRKGTGLLPIRGHSNVQGIGSMGVAPTAKAAFANRLKELYDIAPLPEGQHTYASMEAASQGEVDASFQLGGNLFGSNPDRVWSSEALQKIGFTAMVNTKLNENHAHGRGQTTVILPCLARDEEHQRTSQESMFNFVRLSDGGQPAPKGELKSEVEILAGWAEGILPEGKFDWKRLRDHASLREEIARCVAGYDALTEDREFQVEGRTFHAPRFATPDGKAQAAVTPLPQWTVGEDELRLMTIRSEGQFNTVVYEEEDLYRGIPRRDAILMNAEDLLRRGLAEGQRVKVSSSTGEMAVTVFAVDIAPGCCAMYCPEANVLVPAALDARSKTPAFKSIAVRVRPWG